MAYGPYTHYLQNVALCEKWFRIRIPKREGRLLYRKKSTVVMGKKKKIISMGTENCCMHALSTQVLYLRSPQIEKKRLGASSNGSFFYF